MLVREAGASIVMIDMRYMWSAIDSPCAIPKRRQPSRLVVLSRLRKCRKGRGDRGGEVGRRNIGGIWVRAGVGISMGVLLRWEGRMEGGT